MELVNTNKFIAIKYYFKFQWLINRAKKLNYDFSRQNFKLILWTTFITSEMKLFWINKVFHKNMWPLQIENNFIRDKTNSTGDIVAVFNIFFLSM